MGETGQLSVAAILILLCVRELFAFLKARNGSANCSGNQLVNFWKGEIHKAVRETVTDDIAPVLHSHGDLLRDVAKGVQELVILSRRRQGTDE